MRERLLFLFLIIIFIIKKECSTFSLFERKSLQKEANKPAV
jgi:hypothetical protein